MIWWLIPLQKVHNVTVKKGGKIVSPPF